MEPKDLANLLRFVASAIDAYNPDKATPSPTEAIPAAAPQPPSVEPVTPEKVEPVKLEDLQAIGKELITAGQRKALKDFLEIEGYKSLSIIPEEDYPVIHSKLQNLLSAYYGS